MTICRIELSESYLAKLEKFASGVRKKSNGLTFIEHLKSSRHGDQTELFYSLITTMCVALS